MPYDPRHIRSVDRSRLYPSAAPTAAVPRSWDISITAPGTEGDTWDLTFNGQTVQALSPATPTNDEVATAIRAAAAALVGVTVTGATNRVILTVPAPNGPEDAPASAPTLVDNGTGTSSIAVVSASNAVGFGLTTVDQK